MVGNIKHIIVIESLEKTDGINFTGETLYNDVIRRRIDLYEKDFTHKFHKATSKEEFVEIMKYYQTNAAYLNGGIVFHLEIHGDKDKKGIILKNGDILEWQELSDLLRPINISTCNKLFLSLGVCNGRFFYKGVDPYKKTPYSGFISASMEVSPEEIYISFSKLFEELIENGNIVDSYLAMEKMKTNFYYKDAARLFKEAFNSTLTQMSNDPELKNKIIRDAIDETKRCTGEKLSEFETEMIFKQAIKDIFNRQKKSFDFSNN